jgi:hypothetical protein
VIRSRLKGIDPVAGQVALWLGVVARGVAMGVRVGGTHLPDQKYRNSSVLVVDVGMS